MLAGTTDDGAGLASSLGRRVIRKPLSWLARYVRALIRPLFACSAWAQPATVVVGTPGEGSDLASVRLVGVGSASHCVGRLRHARALL
jgi:hypothetical protein